MKEVFNIGSEQQSVDLLEKIQKGLNIEWCYYSNS
jgi:hypothetical protein